MKTKRLEVLILTPLALERDAALVFVENSTPRQINDLIFNSGVFEGTKANYQITVCQTGSRNTEIALNTQTAIGQVKPDIVILLGIAGGIKDAGIGDVVVGTKAYSYETGKVTKDGFAYRPEVYNSSRELVATAQLVEQLNQWQQRSAAAKEKKAFLGPIASGDKVVTATDSAIYQHIKTHMNDTLCLEMESAGFGNALSRHRNIHCINIRSISDLLDHKAAGDGEGLQEKAAANAAAFAFDLLYQLDPKQLNLAIMTEKELASKVYDQVADAIQANLKGEAVQGDPIWSKVKSLIEEELEDWKADPQDEDAPGNIRTRLRKTFQKNAGLKTEIEGLMQQRGNVSIDDHSVKIENSKNIISGSTINTGGGSVNIGDKTTIDNQFNIENNSGTIYINIDRAIDTGGRPLEKTALHRLKNNLMQNRFKIVLESLLAHTGHDMELQNQVVLLASRWNKLQKEIHMNIIGRSHSNVETNRIRVALLELIDELIEEGQL